MVPNGYSTAHDILLCRDIEHASFVGKDSQDIFTCIISHFCSTFLRAFVKLRKAAIGFVMSVFLSVRTEQLGFHWKDFHKHLYLNIFAKSVGKIQISSKSDENNNTVHEDVSTFMITSR